MFSVFGQTNITWTDREKRKVGLIATEGWYEAFWHSFWGTELQVNLGSESASLRRTQTRFRTKEGHEINPSICWLIVACHLPQDLGLLLPEAVTTTWDLHENPLSHYKPGIHTTLGSHNCSQRVAMQSVQLTIQLWTIVELNQDV